MKNTLKIYSLGISTRMIKTATKYQINISWKFSKISCSIFSHVYTLLINLYLQSIWIMIEWYLPLSLDNKLAIFLYHLQLIFGQHIGSRLSTVAVFWKHVADILHPSSVVFWQHGGFLLPTVSLLTVDCFTSSTICIYFLEAD